MYQSQAPLAITSGRKTVTAAGTCEVLSTETGVVQVLWISPLPTNTGYVSIGGSTTKSTAASEVGVTLQAPFTPLELHNVRPSTVYVDASVSSEGVTFTYLK